MPHKESLDPQGKTVERNMHHLNTRGVDSVRIGKHIAGVVDAVDAAAAQEKVETACNKLLANVIMETCA